MNILVLGGSGLVGSRFTKLNKEKFNIHAPDASEVDILNKDQLLKAFEQFNPEIVINFAAFTDVQAAEKENGDKNGICYKINVEGADNVANVSKDSGVHLIHISTEYVFDGTKSDSPYKEEDSPNPINWYGQTKYFADQFVLDSGCKSTIARISMPYSPYYEAKLDVARFFLGELRAKNKIKVVIDQKITPTLVDDIAAALTYLAERKVEGVFHVSTTTQTSPFDFAMLIAKAFNLDSSLVETISLDEYNKKKQAPLLKYSWLDPSKFINEFGEEILHSVEDGVQIFKQEVD